MVIGIGRVGLPLALFLAEKGFDVVGVDTDAKKISKIQRKVMPFLEEGAGELLKKNYGKSFRAIHETFLDAVVRDASYVIVTLGTPLNDTYGPDLSQVEGLFKKLIPNLTKGQTIILRSTISPGTTELLSRKMQDSGYNVGKDIFLAYCPERISEGRSIEELGEIPQIIGAPDKKSGLKAKELFSKISPIILLTDPRSAELAKLYSNMYRYIDFAIGNEFMMIAEDHNRDIYEILHLVNNGYKRAGLKPPGFTAGPCLVKDGFFLIDKGPYLELVTAAWRINENVPGFLVEKIRLLEPSLNGKKVAILGLSFKKNIDDTRYSLSYKLERHFLSEGAEVFKHDPYVDSSGLSEVLKKADVLVISINHDKFKSLSVDEIKKLFKKECIVCDIWNMLGVGKILFRLKGLDVSSKSIINNKKRIKSKSSKNK
ncbi:MAG: nucleotide sugar dehydrogenase [Candidatus Hodarchaeota archaeon]